MRDRIVSDLLAYHRARLNDVTPEAERADPQNMDQLAARFGYRISYGPNSYLTPPNEITLARGLPRRARRVELAHELSHGLALERDPNAENPLSYEDVVRYLHASVPDMDEHLELLATAGGDELAMPAALVQAVLNRCGWNAQAVWEVARFSGVPLADALRRVVQFDESRRIAGVITKGGYINVAETQHYRLPVWKGQRMPEPHITLGEGVSVFPLPHRPSHRIVLLTVGQWEAA